MKRVSKIGEKCLVPTAQAQIRPAAQIPEPAEESQLKRSKNQEAAEQTGSTQTRARISSGLPLAKRILIYCSVPLILLIVYSVWWAIWYRLPPSAPAVVDLRTEPGRRAYYVTFCASLADNPHGFPGHCYVVWSKDKPKDFLKEETAAFMPRRYWDQIPSLWSNVDGTVWRDAARGNQRNLNVLTAIVDEARFANSKLVRDEFETGIFQAGVRDCTVFGGTIASSIGLRVPTAGYTYPQDFISELKAANSGL